MAVRYQQDKYKAFRSSSEKELRRLAKKYGYELPKNIKNVAYYGNRLGNFIQNIQFENYDQHKGVNAGLNTKELSLKKLTNKSNKETKEASMIIREINKQMHSVRKDINRGLYNKFDLSSELRNYLNLKFDTYEGYLKNATKYNLNNPDKILGKIQEATSMEYVDKILNSINKNHDFVPQHLLDEFRANIMKQSIGQRMVIANKFAEKFHLKYASEIDLNTDLEVRKGMIMDILEESKKSVKYIKDTYTTGRRNL